MIMRFFNIIFYFIFLLFPIALSSQDRWIDMKINALKIIPTDTVPSAVLPHKLQPASVKMPENQKDSIEVAKNAISKTIIALEEGNIGMALFNIYEALNYVPESDQRTKAIAISYYGLIQVKLGNHTRAVTALNTSDSLFKSFGDQSLLAFHYNNLGVFYQKFMTQKQADQFFLRSLAISQRLKETKNMAITLNLLSKGDGDPEERKGYLREAIALNEQSKDSLSLAKNYNNLAHIFLDQKLYDSSSLYLSKAQALAKKNNQLEVIIENAELFSKLLAAKGDYKNALEYLQLASLTKEKSSNNYNAGDIEQMMENRILARKNVEIQLIDNQLNIKKLTLVITVLASLFIIFLLLGFYIYYVINSRRRVQSLVDSEKLSLAKVEHVQNELINIATYLNNRNEVLKNLQQELSRIQRLPSEEIASQVRRTNLYIKHLMVSNEEVEAIMAKTEHINAEFLNKLTTLHPQITKNEKNIALMLRAGLSSKQIATLLECNPKSVNMARYRMRLHLELDSDQNLVSYLKQL